MSETLTPRARAARVHDQYRKQVLSSGSKPDLEKLIAEEMKAFEKETRKAILAEVQEAGKKYSEEDLQKQVEKHRVRLEKQYAKDNERLVNENTKLKEQNQRLKDLDVENRKVIREANTTIKAGVKQAKEQVRSELMDEGLTPAAEVEKQLLAAEKEASKKIDSQANKFQKQIDKLTKRLEDVTQQLKDAKKGTKVAGGAKQEDIEKVIAEEREKLKKEIEKALDTAKEKLLNSVSLQARKGSAKKAPPKRSKKT